jgi:hypothetical protein
MPHTESVKFQRRMLKQEEKGTKEEIDEIERIRPRVRSDCVYCPSCQEKRNDETEGTAVSRMERRACGHDASSVVCHSRPCAFAACRHHLGVDAKSGGGLVINYDGPDGPLGNGSQPTCALDVADRQELTLESIGGMLGITREAIRHIEVAALRNLRDGLRPWEENQS